MTRFVSAVAIAAVAGLFVVSGVSTTPGALAAELALQDNPIAPSEESIAAGRGTYGRFCRSCHGIGADGRGPTTLTANLLSHRISVVATSRRHNNSPRLPETNSDGTPDTPRGPGDDHYPVLETTHVPRPALRFHAILPTSLDRHERPQLPEKLPL